MGTHWEVAISDQTPLSRLNRFSWVLNRFNDESIQLFVESIHGFILTFFTLLSSRLLSLRPDRFQLYTCTKNPVKHTQKHP